MPNLTSHRKLLPAYLFHSISIFLQSKKSQIRETIHLQNKGTAASPMPVLGLLMGLGAAALVLRRK